ncbi:MAG: hypothetical protein GC159_14715 [Phycisphaera sp.]|nr:hypothetical protein [Phycisphaera sp.]
MRAGILRAWWAIAPVLIGAMAWTSTVLAQDEAAAPAAAPAGGGGGGGGGGSASTSAFQMFFLSDNILGLIITWVLIIMSVCTMALVIKYYMENRLLTLMPPESVAAMEELLAERRFREAIERAAADDSTFGQILHASLSEAANGYASMQRAIEDTADILGAKRVRSVEVLNVLGAVGPMIGLFGTVYGMIVAFQTIVEVGGQPDPAELAGGISTALVTTFWGLIVGIPAVAAAALVRNKIEDLMIEIVIQCEAMISQFQPGAKKKAAASSGSAGAAPRPRPA